MLYLINNTYNWPKKTLATKKFQIQNRRFLGNKFKLLVFIEDIVKEKCGDIESFCDIFAGTGVVGNNFNREDIKIISNDLLYSNFVSLKTFIGTTSINVVQLQEKIEYLNSLGIKENNYFSINFGNRYFTIENAIKIGLIREKIEEISESIDEKEALLTALIYATDKVANTVGHYDAYRKKMDTCNALKLMVPDVNQEYNYGNEILNEDANSLIRRISCDVLYIDPPYNSRQYSDTYHLLENLAVWKKPKVYGKAKKMKRTHLKSKYCLKSAAEAFEDLIRNAKCKHILVSYNNTGESKHGRSNSRIKDREIMDILKTKGKAQIFERGYQAFTTGKSETNGHTERVFYCEVKK